MSLITIFHLSSVDFLWLSQNILQSRLLFFNVCFCESVEMILHNQATKTECWNSKNVVTHNSYWSFTVDDTLSFPLDFKFLEVVPGFSPLYSTENTLSRVHYSPLSYHIQCLLKICGKFFLLETLDIDYCLLFFRLSSNFPNITMFPRK